MKKRLFALCALIFCALAQAQPKTSPDIALTSFKAPEKLQKAFLPSKQFRFVRAYSALAGPGGKPVWLLFYARRATSQEEAREKKFSILNGDSGVASLVVIDKERRGSDWHLVRSVPLGATRLEKVSLYWLTPKIKKGPIVVVSQESNFDFCIGDHEVIAFPEGWRQRKAVRQVFQDYGNSVESADNRFETVDERGFLQVTQYFYNTGEDTSLRKVEKHVWNGTGWEK